MITSDQLTDKEIVQRTKFNDLNTKIYDYIEWQESKEGRSVNLPKIEETHKDILFTYWDAQIKQAELVVARVAGVAINIIKVVNHTLHITNLIK